MTNKDNNHELQRWFTVCAIKKLYMRPPLNVTELIHSHTHNEAMNEKYPLHSVDLFNTLQIMFHRLKSWCKHLRGKCENKPTYLLRHLSRPKAWFPLFPRPVMHMIIELSARQTDVHSFSKDKRAKQSQSGLLNLKKIAVIKTLTWSEKV